MGSLKRFNLSKISKQYECPYFFETGTWTGNGLAYAKNTSFVKLYSSEIMPEIADKARKRFASENRIEIFTGNSTAVFEQTLHIINGNCVFWLDAHFPGAEEGLKDYNEYDNEQVKLPLEKELQLIKDIRSTFYDVILIDDLRIYETGPFTSGNLPEGILPPSFRSIDFVFKLFGDSHEVIRSYEDEGYLLLFPKQKYHALSSSSESFFEKIQNRIRKRIY